MTIVQAIDLWAARRCLSINAALKELKVGPNLYYGWRKGSFPHRATISRLAPLLGVDTGKIILGVTREKEKLDSGVFLRDPSLEAGLPTDLAIIQMPRSAWNELSGILYRYNAALVGSINLPTPHKEAVVTNTLTHDFAA